MKTRKLFIVSLTIIIVTLPLVSFCQSFIFCPEIETPEKQGFDNVKVAIVFDDSRSFEKKKKEKCTKDQIFEEFANCIKRTYPNMQLIVLDGKTFYDDPAKGIITIKVKFKQYDATFHTGIYNSKTNYEVKIFDNRTTEKASEQTFTGEAKTFNALGYKNAKNACNKSFKEAFDKFILMVEVLK